jgi:hypothetical protein
VESELIAGRPAMRCKTSKRGIISASFAGARRTYFFRNLFWRLFRDGPECQQSPAENWALKTYPKRSL